MYNSTQVHKDHLTEKETKVWTTFYWCHELFRALLTSENRQKTELWRVLEIIKCFCKYEDKMPKFSYVAKQQGYHKHNYFQEYLRPIMSTYVCVSAKRNILHELAAEKTHPTLRSVDPKPSWWLHESVALKSKVNQSKSNLSILIFLLLPPICPPIPPSLHPHSPLCSLHSSLLQMFDLFFWNHPGVYKYVWQAWFVDLCASPL